MAAMKILGQVESCSYRNSLTPLTLACLLEWGKKARRNHLPKALRGWSDRRPEAGRAVPALRAAGYPLTGSWVMPFTSCS